MLRRSVQTAGRTRRQGCDVERVHHARPQTCPAGATGVSQRADHDTPICHHQPTGTIRHLSILHLSPSLRPCGAPGTRIAPPPPAEGSRTSAPASDPQTNPAATAPHRTKHTHNHNNSASPPCPSSPASHAIHVSIQLSSYLFYLVV